MSDAELLAEGKKILSMEKDALAKIESELGDAFLDAVHLILQAKGNVIFSGVGKSGHICRKLAATFASTGTTSFFVHADEAAHGDLGMIRPGDVFIGISFSGEADELMTLMPALKAMNIPVIAMTGRPNSSLAKSADVALITEIEREACPLNLAPTTSTTVTMALGDAIACALMVARNFSAEDFARSHPAGALGRRLLLNVHNVMRNGDKLPVVGLMASATEAVKMLAHKHLGLFVVVDDADRPVGIFTEGDLCRAIESGIDLRDKLARDIVNRSPKSISPDASAFAAMRLIKEHKINQLLVVDDNTGKLVGIVHVQDLVAKKIS